MLPKGLGNLSNIGGMVKHAVELKANIAKLQEQLADERIEASAGGGMVTVIISGKLEVVSVSIEPEIIDKDDPEMLETLVMAALNEANRKGQELVQTKMTELTGGLDMPGLSDAISQFTDGNPPTA